MIECDGAVMINFRSRYVKNIICCTAFCMIIMLLCSCGNGKRYTVPSSNETTFNEVFLSFAELRGVALELINEPISAEWWNKFDSVSGTVSAIIDKNNELIAGSNLSETDRQLAAVLVSVASGYHDGFAVMSASRDSGDAEIISYAYSEFTAKIQNADSVWSSAVSAAAASE